MLTCFNDLLDSLRLRTCWCFSLRWLASCLLFSCTCDHIGHKLSFYVLVSDLLDFGFQHPCFFIVCPEIRKYIYDWIKGPFDYYQFNLRITGRSPSAPVYRANSRSCLAICRFNVRFSSWSSYKTIIEELLREGFFLIHAWALARAILQCKSLSHCKYHWICLFRDCVRGEEWSLTEALAKCHPPLSKCRNHLLINAFLTSACLRLSIQKT